MATGSVSVVSEVPVDVRAFTAQRVQVAMRTLAAVDCSVGISTLSTPYGSPDDPITIDCGSGEANITYVGTATLEQGSLAFSVPDTIVPLHGRLLFNFSGTPSACGTAIADITWTNVIVDFQTQGRRDAPNGAALLLSLSWAFILLSTLL
eukprot:Gregarina_sp_Pseudo_9__5676@NODE_804_length_2198_cov_7_837425_g756_i0_p2_GENE_NODE_804_length_2198_cov_7_837425_g756_i0NODE_804_length_2198_cov_7_837425_g756_i0_p2_ORF_typecomplete_len150_score17_22_NODE_804_length_2198_cov_7_837425_g756_i0245694